jgi:Ser-tRNA(Ala) deacylase AlaX
LAVEKVFWTDPYRTELGARVTQVWGDVLALDRTIFYAFSGGQESDRGTIGGHAVLRAEKTGKEIRYTVPAPHGFAAGDSVVVRIDWPRRYRLMRLHFAAELVLELTTRHLAPATKIGAHISEEKARLDFTWEGNISRAFSVLEAGVRDLVASDLPIRSAFSDPEAEERYWEVEGLARVACGGTHLRRTGEVGGVVLKRVNIGKGKERIEIALRDWPAAGPARNHPPPAQA